MSHSPYAVERPGERIRNGADLVIGDLGRTDVAVLVTRRPGGDWSLQVRLPGHYADRVFSGGELQAHNLPEIAATMTRRLIGALDEKVAESRSKGAK